MVHRQHSNFAFPGASLLSLVFFFSSRRRHTRLTCDWSSDVCSSDLVQQAADASFPGEEALSVACLLALTGGYLESYTWIVHRVFANAQTANLVFLWVYLTDGNWEEADRFVLPLIAFGAGVMLACWLRWVAPEQASRTSLIIEIIFLFVVAILHNRVPERAGTLGISLVAAFQTVSFPRVEGLNYSSVMATNNFRQTVEGLFARS